MKFIIGKKLNMTQIFADDGTVVPVTKVQAGPCQVVLVKNDDGKQAVQIAYGESKEKHLTKAQKGHLKGLTPSRVLGEFSVSEKDEKLHRGDMLTIDIFSVGDLVKVTGHSKGRGFAGVVKRHGFAGGPASHGHKDNLRAPGSIGAGGVQRVFKGTRMGGHMGDAQVTVTNLEIVKIVPPSNELYIKGAVPGARNGILRIVAEGDLKLKTPNYESQSI